MAYVYSDRFRVPRWLGAPERGFYRLSGTDPSREQDWKGYARVALVFMVVFSALLYLLLRLQAHLPLNPDGLAGRPSHISMNTRRQLRHEHELAVLRRRVHDVLYLSRWRGLRYRTRCRQAIGMAVLVAVVRGFSRRSTTNWYFWVDLYRSIAYVLLPLVLVLAVILVSQGVVQTFSGAATAPPRASAAMSGRAGRARAQRCPSARRTRSRRSPRTRCRCCSPASRRRRAPRRIRATPGCRSRRARHR